MTHPKIHTLPSGRFCFHEDDFSRAEFHTEIAWRDPATKLRTYHPGAMALLMREGATKEFEATNESFEILVAIVYFRSQHPVSQTRFNEPPVLILPDPTRLEGEDAAALQTLLRQLGLTCR